MSNPKQWYVRSHDFAPYTRADGVAVAEEFDAIQASFEVIPAMRSDGTGFAVSPIIPDAIEDDHPVTFRQLKTGEQSVLQMKQAVEQKRDEVARNTQTTATNTQTAVNAKTQAVSSAQQAASSAQTASQQARAASQSATAAANSAQTASQQQQLASQKATQAVQSATNAQNAENLAQKWAANPEDNVVQNGKFSAFHYANKARKQAEIAEQAKDRSITAETNAQQSQSIATQKATEITALVSSAQEAKDITTQSVQQIRQSEQNISDIKVAVEQLKQQAEQAKETAETFKTQAESAKGIAEQKANEAISVVSQAARGNRGASRWEDIENIPTATINQAGITQLDNAINSNAEDRAATPKAVKRINDKATTAQSAAENALNVANSKQSPATTLAGYGITDFKIENHTFEYGENVTLDDFIETGIYNIEAAPQTGYYPISIGGYDLTGVLLFVIKSELNKVAVQTAYGVGEDSGGIVCKYERIGEDYTETGYMNWGDWQEADVRDLTDRVDTLESFTTPLKKLTKNLTEVNFLQTYNQAKGGTNERDQPSLSS